MLSRTIFLDNTASLLGMPDLTVVPQPEPTAVEQRRGCRQGDSRCRLLSEMSIFRCFSRPWIHSPAPLMG